MKKFSKSKSKLQCDHALLALIGQKCQDEKLLDPLYQLVKINQKTVQYSPVDKLIDLLLAILLDCEVVSQINTKLAQQVAVLNAFGREHCADQSTVQRTLSTCTSENVAQFQAALARLFARHSRTRHHNFAKGPLILDIDLTGLPCSKHYQGSCKGYFAGCKPGTTGRQLFRVSASQYNELVYQQVFPGNTGSASLENFKPMLEAAFGVLGLAAKHTRRVLIRLDSGFGNAPIINYLLAQGYQFVVKLGNAPRAIKLCQSVAEWQPDFCHQREFGLIQAEGGYELAGQRVVYQIGVRHIPPEKSSAERLVKAKKGAEAKSPAPAQAQPGGPNYHYNVLVLGLEGLKPAKSRPVEGPELLAQVHFYDRRAVIETASIKADKQGLGLVKRRKFSLMGQEMEVLLAQLAHNLVMWAKGWLLKLAPELAGYGVERWVRDLLAIAGQVIFQGGRIVKVRLSQRNSLARRFYKPLKRFFAKRGIEVDLGYH